VLKLLNVESAYGPIKAIRGVSLQVRRGEIATVLGSNGAGKTTILKTISGIIDPRKGSIEFKGKDITARDPALIVQQGLSHVPEGREVFPLLSVRDNLLMGAYTRRDRDGVARDIEAVYRLFPHPARARHAGRRPAVGRAAADAGDQPRAHGRARPDPAGRAQPGPVAQSSPRKSSRSWCASTASAAPPSCWWSRTPTWR
jgi:energy-coupling factor transporter ATP-binding protein EcfA2